MPDIAYDYSMLTTLNILNNSMKIPNCKNMSNNQCYIIYRNVEKCRRGR